MQITLNWNKTNSLLKPVLNYSNSFVFEAWTCTFSTIRSNSLLRLGSNVLRFLLTIQRYNLSWSFVWQLHESFRPFVTYLRLETVMKRSGTVNGWRYWTVRNVYTCEDKRSDVYNIAFMIRSCSHVRSASNTKVLL